MQEILYTMLILPRGILAPLYLQKVLPSLEFTSTQLWIDIFLAETE